MKGLGSSLFIVLVITALLGACSPGIDEKKFDKVSRAAKTIEGSCMVGINYVKFGELLQNLATEVNILKDQLKTKQEGELFKIYLEVLQTYRDSAEMWKTKIDGSSFVPEGRIFIMNNDQLVKKYGLDIQIHQGLNRDLNTVSESSIQIIWNRAGELIKKATDYQVEKK